MKKNKMKNFIL